MKGKKPQKQLLQFVMLSLLSIVSVLVMANESFAALACNACHGTSAPVDMRPLDAGTRDVATGGFVGSHRKHMTSAAVAPTDCNICHTNAAKTTTFTAGHRDGGIQMSSDTNVVYSKGAFFNQTSVPTPLGTCSTAICHASTTTPAYNKTTPVWGTASDCNSCHDATPSTGKHTKHLTSADHLPVCSDCHSGATASSGGPGHFNGTIEVVGYSTSPVNKHAVNTYAGTCSTTYCHSSGQALNGTAIGPVYAPITWSSPASNCGTCHASPMTSGSHANHVAKDSNCGNCHTGASATTYASLNHVDGFINVSGSKNVKYTQGRSHAPGNGYGTCNNASCHAVFSNAAPNTIPVWGTSATAGCTYCHSAAPVTGAHGKHLVIPVVSALNISSTSCNYCHTPVNSVSDATHMNGTTDFIGGMMASVPPHLAGDPNYAATCTVSCHTPYTNAGAGTTPNWGVKNANNCGLCHEVSPTTGVHARHIANTATIADCSTCHAGAIVNSNGGTGHLNGTIEVTQYAGGSVAKHLSGNANYSATCTTACHNPYSTSVAISTPNWGATTSTCASCHNGAGALTGTGSGPATGSHNVHMAHPATVPPTPISCASCHVGTIANTSGGTYHLSGMVNVSTAGGGHAKSVAKHTSGSGYMSCTVTCHNGPGFTAPAIAWGATGNCNNCHGYPPAGASHTGVSAVTAGSCNSCHSEVAISTVVTTPLASAFATPSLHMNGVVDGGNCNSCHGYPPVESMAGKGINANYSTAKLENYSGGGGAHSVAGHLALTLKDSQKLGFAGCIACHPSGSHNEGAGVFKTANVQVTVDPKFKFNTGSPIVYTRNSGAKSTGTCSNVSCHFQKTPNWSTETFTQGH